MGHAKTTLLQGFERRALGARRAPHPRVPRDLPRETLMGVTCWTPSCTCCEPAASGVTWPRTSRPSPLSGVYFDHWRHNGTLETIHDTLRDRLRTQEKPGQPRRTASIDSQSVDTSSGGEARGRDNAKKVDGRKRHIIVDSLGLLLAVVVTAADVDDAAAAPAALAQLAGQPLGKVRKVYADSKHHNHALHGWVAEHGWYEL